MLYKNISYVPSCPIFRSFGISGTLFCPVYFLRSAGHETFHHSARRHALSTVSQQLAHVYKMFMSGSAFLASGVSEYTK